MPAATGPAARGAFAACDALARTHYENFPVRAPFLPREMRHDLAAIYAFCRTTDDLGDEYTGDRLAALAAWEERVCEALAGEAPSGVPLLSALAVTARRRGIRSELFLRVIEANRRDQTTHPHADEASLLDYCSYSATPVGRMVLRVAGHDDARLDALADATCVGLQLANFWQDLARDWAMGRCYLPLDACARHGVIPEIELAGAVASPALRALVAERVADARLWLLAGWPLAERMSLRWRPVIRAFSRGGWAILNAIEAQGFDTLAARPVVSRSRRRGIVARELLRAPLRGISLAD
ncbi:MAG: squalene synthase HpnC [Gemmatimonadota bacterium]